MDLDIPDDAGASAKNYAIADSWVAFAMVNSPFQLGNLKSLGSNRSLE